MPFRCVEFSGWLGWLGAQFVIMIMLWVVGFAVNAMGLVGKFVMNFIWAGLSLYSTYVFFNMIGTVTGLRGNCPQGYRSGWPPIRGSVYHRDPVTGLRTEDVEASLW